MALLVLAQGAQPATVARPDQARVTLRIRQAAPASEREWRKAPPASRREIERKDESGRTIVIRVIEHQ
ncbi:MAG TPA: hypothetical protein VJ775_02745 [Sphingomicrobium sp.]|nr:hypothetical protein [Sphingomicrobium sp.]